MTTWNFPWREFFLSHIQKNGMIQPLHFYFLSLLITHLLCSSHFHLQQLEKSALIWFPFWVIVLKIFSWGNISSSLAGAVRWTIDPTSLHLCGESPRDADILLLEVKKNNLSRNNLVQVKSSLFFQFNLINLHGVTCSYQSVINQFVTKCVTTLTALIVVSLMVFSFESKLIISCVEPQATWWHNMTWLKPEATHVSFIYASSIFLSLSSLNMDLSLSFVLW